jgi:cell division protein FtsW (lipid II flippase)
MSAVLAARPAPAARFAAGIATLVELVAVIAVVLGLQPGFDKLATLGDGAQARFAAPLDAATNARAGGTPRTADATPAPVVAPDTPRALADARKNEAMRALVRAAGPQWAIAIGLTYAFVLASRRRAMPPLAGAGLALIAWAALAWWGRVAFPFGGGAAPRFARPELALEPNAAPFVYALAGIGIGLLLLAAAQARARDDRARTSPPALAAASRLGFPGLVLATGTGALLLLDLSLRGAYPNRYLALYHQGHLWFGLMLFCALLFLREPLARALAWTLAAVGEAASALARRAGGLVAALLVTGLALAAVATLAAVFAHKQQLTSEIGHAWLVIGAGWFFHLRGGPLAERLARVPRGWRSLVRYAWPMLLLVGVLIALMVAIHNMGPLLIAGYAAGAFVAATLAGWWHQRRGSVAVAFVLAVVLFAAWIATVTGALFALGAVDPVAAMRLESVAAPLASANDQLALVTWFQEAAPANGFGLGAVPWCGYGTGTRCHGVPMQVQSDYTFTALVGAFGATVAWGAAIGAAVWLHRLVRQHGRVTRGEPRWVLQGARRVPDVQALLSWIGVAWVVLTSCQLAVTIAGNVAVLPLTGVTFPFVSFGMTSLVLNLGFLALVLHVEPAHG